MVACNTFQCSMAPALWNPFRRPYRGLYSKHDTVLIWFMDPCMVRCISFWIWWKYVIRWIAHSIWICTASFICNLKRIFPSNSTEWFDFTYHSFGLESLSGNLKKPMFVCWLSLSCCAFLHTRMQQCFPFLHSLSCFCCSSTVFL